MCSAISPTQAAFDAYKKCTSHERCRQNCGDEVFFQLSRDSDDGICGSHPRPRIITRDVKFVMLPRNGVVSRNGTSCRHMQFCMCKSLNLNCLSYSSFDWQAIRTEYLCPKGAQARWFCLSQTESIGRGNVYPLTPTQTMPNFETPSPTDKRYDPQTTSRYMHRYRCYHPPLTSISFQKQASTEYPACTLDVRSTRYCAYAADVLIYVCAFGQSSE